MTNPTRLLTGFGAALLFLAACGGGGGDGAGDASDFGNLFDQAFAQGPNDVPKDDPNLVIVYQGVMGVDPTAGPIDL